MNYFINKTLIIVGCFIPTYWYWTVFSPWYYNMCCDYWIMEKNIFLYFIFWLAICP